MGFEYSALRVIVAGRILAVHDHPNGDKIWLAVVDTGSRIVTVVFGGLKKLQPGMIVPYAPPGTIVLGKKMRVRRYRGVRSVGMLCSRAEAGLPPPHPDEVAILDEDTSTLFGSVPQTTIRMCG